MKKSTLTVLGVIGIIVLIVAGACNFYTGTYNSFVAMEEQINGQWAQVENQYQRQMKTLKRLGVRWKTYISAVSI